MQLLQSHLPISPNISRHGISSNLYYSTSASSLELHIIKKPQALVYFFSNSTFLYAIFTEDWIKTSSNHFRMIPLLVWHHWNICECPLHIKHDCSERLQKGRFCPVKICTGPSPGIAWCILKLPFIWLKESVRFNSWLGFGQYPSPLWY